MTRTVQRLSGIGKQLAQPPHTKDAILKQLKQAAEMLSEMKQTQDVKASIQPLTNALTLPTILKHKDKDVRLLATSCIVEILRIVAPYAPYSDKELQDVFHEVISAFEGLNDISSSSFSRRSAILEIMANLRICVMMLDVGCDELIPEMFQIFFSVVSDKDPPSVINAMQAIMAAILEESENVPLALLDTILNNLLKHKKGVSPAAHKLAVGVVRQCADKLEPYVQRLLTSVMLEGGKAEIDLHADYHEIIFEIYQCVPEMLLAVIPNLTQELVNDQVSIRLKAVRLLGRLFALPGRHVAKEYHQLFLEFLKRFTDKATEVRLAMIDCAKDCLRANPSGNEATEILGGLDDRILDSEETIRLRTVVVVCELAKQNYKWIPISLLKHIAERLRDKKVLVRKEAFNRLADVYRAYATKCYDGSSFIDNKLEWIPGKLLRCCYDKDVKEFRPAGVELVFVEKLFPRQLSASERARHWVSMYSFFEDIDKRALAKIIVQKKRLQEDVSKFLKLRQREKGSVQEQPEIQQLFKGMTSLFVDDSKVEEHFQKLHSMKDNKIFKALSDLSNPLITFTESETILDDLLKRIGEHHPQHDFIKMLAVRCSYMLFDKELVKEVADISSEGNLSSDTTITALSLIAELAGVFPVLLQNAKDKIAGMLLEGDDMVKEKVSEIIARAGSAVFGESGISSSIESMLQKLCMEGTRKQAKYAVAALVAIKAVDGFKALSVLFGRLVEQLQEGNLHLPAVLQSVSCIAQRAISIFETREDDIVRFVVRSLLQKDAEGMISECEVWDKPSKMCQLKIFGLKTLVKSFLPYKHHPRRRLRGLLGLLTKILPVGEIADTVKSSENDKAHLRLASAKGLLRLARRWDPQIPEPVYHLCLMTAQDSCINVRQGFLKKMHQYLKDHTLNHKYASAYALFVMDSSKEILSEAKHHLNEFIESARLEARTLKKSVSQSDASLITYNPEYVIPYLVHVLAYHPCFPHSGSDNADSYEPVYRFLLFYLRPLVHVDIDETPKGTAENIPAILAIFRTIKKADDALDGKKTANLRIICDIGIMITKELGSSSLYPDGYPGLIPLPSSLYSVKSNDGENLNMIDGSHLPACLMDEDVLSHLWYRCSRNGQVQPSLGSNVLSRKEKSLATVLEDRKSPNVSAATNEVLRGENGALEIVKSAHLPIEDRKTQGKRLTEHDKHNVSERLRRCRRDLRMTTHDPRPEAVSDGMGLHKHSVISDQQAQDITLPKSDKAMGTTRSASPSSKVRFLRRDNAILDKQTKESATSSTADNSSPRSPGMGMTDVDTPNLLGEGGVLRKRHVGSKQEAHQKASPKSKKVNITDSPRRSSRLLSGAGEAVGMTHGVISYEEAQGTSLPRLGKAHVSESPGMESIAVDKTKSASAVSEGRVLRKCSVLSDKQSKENSIAGPDDNASKDQAGFLSKGRPRSSCLLDEVRETLGGRVLQISKGKRNVTLEMEDREKVSLESQRRNVSKSPRRSSRLLSEVGEVKVLEMSKAKPDDLSSKEPVRSLRRHGVVTEQQDQEQNSIQSDDEDTTVTWRSRRRKVQ